MEPTLRERYGGAESYRPSVEEEMFAWTAESLGYQRMRAEFLRKGDTYEADPVLDRLAEIVKAGDLRGFVLYEVLHKSYGLGLESLTAQDAKAVEKYLLALLHHTLCESDR